MRLTRNTKELTKLSIQGFQRMLLVHLEKKFSDTRNPVRAATSETEGQNSAL